MLFCLLEYLQMLEHIWKTFEKKKASLFLTMKERGGGGPSFSLLTLSVWGGGGGAGEIFCQL